MRVSFVSADCRCCSEGHRTARIRTRRRLTVSRRGTAPSPRRPSCRCASPAGRRPSGSSTERTQFAEEKSVLQPSRMMAKYNTSCILCHSISFLITLFTRDHSIDRMALLFLSVRLLFFISAVYVGIFIRRREFSSFSGRLSVFFLTKNNTDDNYKIMTQIFLSVTILFRIK